MHRSTLIFGALTILLGGSTGALIWHASTLPSPVGATAQAATDIPLALSSSEVPTNVPADGSSSLLWDGQQQSIVSQENAFVRRPLASITKLMTAMVAIDYGIPWNKQATINLNEYGPGGNLVLSPGEFVTMKDLFHASLIGSANNATKAYVRQLGMSEEEFVLAMNRKAVEIGLEQTTFVEPSGLDPQNVSTAYDVARMSYWAFTHYPEISQATSQTNYVFTVGGSGRQHDIKNTNKQVADGQLGVTGSKTGYLDEAKYCLVIKGTGDLKNFVAVIMGSNAEEQNELATTQLLTSGGN